MKKISTVFKIDRDKDEAVDEVRDENRWVLDGEGVATIKFDGTSCLWKDAKLWKRFDRKLNRQAQERLNWGDDLGEIRDELFRVAPEGFEPCIAAPDPVTFHWPGWVPVSETAPEDKWHREALAHLKDPLVEGSTYELVGPSLAKNIYELPHHQLWRHGEHVVELKDRSFNAVRDFLKDLNAEGLVFHHPDGRMAKIRRKDFNFFWVMEDVRKLHRKPKMRR